VSSEKVLREGGPHCKRLRPYCMPEWFEGKYVAYPKIVLSITTYYNIKVQIYHTVTRSYTHLLIACIPINDQTTDLYVDEAPPAAKRAAAPMAPVLIGMAAPDFFEDVAPPAAED
jgi:hypothetical protein